MNVRLFCTSTCINIENIIEAIWLVKGRITHCGFALQKELEKHNLLKFQGQQSSCIFF